MTQKTIGGFLKTMQDYSFVDHGFYSAMILLKWYGEIIQRRGRDNGLFLSHILDAAASIFLHNAYRNVFMREPYSLDALSPSIQPFAYLLILCDEAQEWNREAYGEVTKQLILVDDSKIEIDDNLMKLHYITKKGVLNEEFVIEKTEFINNLLDIVSIFEAGIKVTATTRTEKLIHDLVKSRDNLYPRLLIEYIETIAVKIHEMYIANQISKNPGKLPEYPTWESLPDTLKYSNVRQAKDMVKKLDMVDCYIASGSSDEEVKFFSEEETEFLASYEHRLWVDERLYNGWTFSEVKDISKKQSPYLIGYEELPEDIKDLDRDTIRNILPLLKEVGLKVYRMAADGQN
jgi:hypothetical protein